MKNSLRGRSLWAAALLLSAAVGSAKDAPAPGVLVRVNGVPIKRADVADRTWKTYATTVLNQMVDEILIRQAAAAAKIKPDQNEVAARLNRIQSQFADPEAFKKALADNGGSPEALRATIEDQVLREALVVKAKDLSVAEAEVREFFDANKEKLGVLEAVHLRHILVANEKEANDFLVAIRAGADFARLASQVSLDNATKDKGGDLGFISRGMLQPDLEKAVFALKLGETSAPLAVGGGYHIFKVEDQRPAKPAVYSEVGKDLKAALLGDKINKAFPAYVAELRAKAKIEPVVPPK